MAKQTTQTQGTSTPATGGNGKPKKVAPITRQQFRDKAPSSITLQLTAGSLQLPGVVAIKKEFETGSLGWNANAKLVIDIDGKACEVQVGCNFTIIGSKELPK